MVFLVGLMKTSTILIVLSIWFVAALSTVAAGGLAKLPFPPPMLIAALALLTIILGFTVAKEWLRRVDLRSLVAIHLVRFVGIAFLLRVYRGELSDAFVPIGWGDTIAAVGAVLLLLARVSGKNAAEWWALLLWNVLGFADMLMLIATGIRMGSIAPEQFALFRELPFGLLPTFFVPLIVATHVFVFWRLFRARS